MGILCVSDHSNKPRALLGSQDVPGNDPVGQVVSGALILVLLLLLLLLLLFVRVVLLVALTAGLRLQMLIPNTI
tara:strand:- start:153 stop:374 length:222 start_codon:yes stop_codon:yes gene_type:complete